MGLLDYLNRLAGEGTVRVIGETSDGERFEVKMPYTGDPGSITEAEYISEVATLLRVERGVKVSRMKIDSVYGTGLTRPNWSLKWYTVKRRDE